MSQEYFGKYNKAKRVSLFPTIDDPIVIIMGLTIADLSAGVGTFLVFAIFLGSPLVGLVFAIAAIFFCKQYSKRFPRGALVQSLWRFRLYKKMCVPTLMGRTSQTLYGP